jgi:hypothetical protein
VNFSGLLETKNLVLQVLSQRPVDVAAGARHYTGRQSLTEPLVRDTNDRVVGYVRVFGKSVFQCARINVSPPGMIMSSLRPTINNRPDSSR